MNLKKCSKCKIDKSVDYFHKRSGGYLRSRCVDCSKEDRKKYESDNIESIKLKNKDDYENRKEYHKRYNKKYRELNKDSERDRQRLWSIRNRENINKRNIKYRDENLKDPLFRIKESIRNLIRVSIKSNGFNKSTKTSIILGCSISEFKEHIESLFEFGMSWDNYPNWHLDHKIPISWAKTEEDIIKLNHYTNFQPKWLFDNLSKGNRYSD